MSGWPGTRLLLNDETIKLIHATKRYCYTESIEKEIIIPKDYHIKFWKKHITKQLSIRSDEIPEVDRDTLIWLALEFGFTGSAKDWSFWKENYSPTHYWTNILQVR